MKSNGKNATKTTANRNGKLKAASRKAAKTSSSKRPAKKAASKKRLAVKSTVPPKFRELKRLEAAEDPRFWELRKEFRDYFNNLSEEEVEPFLEGLRHPYTDYLAIELVRQSWRENPVNIWGSS